jgi:hypothetical protein
MMFLKIQTSICAGKNGVLGVADASALSDLNNMDVVASER